MKTVQLPLGLNGRPDAQTAAWYFAYVRYPDWPKSQDRRMSLVKSALVLVSGGKTQPEFGEVQPVRVKSRLEIAANVIVRERIAAAWAAYQRLRERPRPDPRQPRRMQDELRRALIKPRDTAFEQVIAGLPSISNVESFRRRIWYSSVPSLAMAAPLFKLIRVDKRRPEDLLFEPDWVTWAVEMARHDAPILKQRLQLKRDLLVPEFIKPTLLGEGAIGRYLGSAWMARAWPRPPEK